MMQRRGLRILQILTVLFIGVNFLLVYLDDENKVDRISYINHWSESFSTDIADELYKPGVLAYSSEEHIYFDESLGSFQQFGVEEGSRVSEGDPLFSYQVDNYYQTEADLMGKIETLNGEIAAIETAISEMNLYEIPDDGAASSTQTSLPDIFTGEIGGDPPGESPFGGDEDNSIGGTQPAQNDPIRQTQPSGESQTAEAELIKEQYIIEKEMELAAATAELESAEAQLTELQQTGDTITMESPFAGRVSDVSISLGDPLLTIENAPLQAEGELSERERATVEEGMPVTVKLKETNAVLTGEISQISDAPKALQVDGESVYPFEITFDEEIETEGLLPGYHGNLAISVQVSENATVLFDDVVFADTVWKMNEEGKLIKQTVETGIKRDSMLEITSGVEPGEWAADEPSGRFRDGATFITPLQPMQVPWSDFFSHENRLADLLTGVLSR
ncbi:efflux RND transporter periplasmic adaptor subunit [Lentibacillus sediminis]|uniref:efflux RND transporter periplasmic adaptor subunit n=1 Tax=Lentibacillus sediminis TaxID=1940529 RepID=UPI001EFD8C77|nr:HlyD family efflux transporter periplasmic adaptor subunit [Lentibacillus sediminis]